MELQSQRHASGFIFGSKLSHDNSGVRLTLVPVLGRYWGLCNMRLARFAVCPWASYKLSMLAACRT